MLFDEKNRLSVTNAEAVPGGDLHIIKQPSTTQFIIIDKIGIDVFVFGQITVSWTLQSTTLDINLFSVFVERSGSPEGEFTRLNTIGLMNQFSYVDGDASYFSKQRFVYYRLVFVKDAQSEAVRTGPKTFYEMPDLIGLEIARRNKLLLDRFVGRDCVLYKRRNWGNRCPDCWDSKLQRVTKSRCTTCYDTGYERGYWQAINIKVNFSPSDDIMKLAPWGKTEPSAASAWAANYPLIEDMDVIIELTRNRRWAVVQKVNIEKMRVPIRQILKIEELEKSRVEFDLPVN